MKSSPKFFLSLSSTFLPPTSRTPSRNGTPSTSSRPSSRTASASPGPYRKRNPSTGSYSHKNGSETEETLSYLSSSTTVGNSSDFPTSTHSTPARKPGRHYNNNNNISSLNKSSVGGSEFNRRPGGHNGGMSKTSKSSHGLADLDAGEDDQILKRMEEILLTYKARVENHLAAEGRELPKEIFEDFTTQWVATCKSPTASPPVPVAKSMSNGNLLSREPSSSKLVVTPRRDPIPGPEKKTRIPMPTFYNSPIPTETNI